MQSVDSGAQSRGSQTRADPSYTGDVGEVRGRSRHIAIAGVRAGIKRTAEALSGMARRIVGRRLREVE